MTIRLRHGRDQWQFEGTLCVVRYIIVLAHVMPWCRSLLQCGDSESLGCASRLSVCRSLTWARKQPDAKPQKAEVSRVECMSL